MESWTTKKVMEYLQCGRSAVRGLVKRGLLKMVKVGNRNIFVAEQVKSLISLEQK